MAVEHFAQKVWDGQKITLGLRKKLMDLFVKGQDGTYNKKADFDYLACVFADLAKFEEIITYFVQEQPHDGIIPLSKPKVFTEHKSEVRRKGVASTIKNVAFGIPSHPALLSESGIKILPYVLLPITGNEEFDEDDVLEMVPDLQLLPRRTHLHFVGEIGALLPGSKCDT